MASRELNLLIKAKNLASGAIASVKKELGGLNKDLGRIGSKAGHNLARNFERGVIAAGAGIAAGATFAITTAASFEQAEAGIRKTVGGSIEEVDALVAKVREMAREVPLSFEELAAIAESGGALGVSTSALDEFTDVVARLSVSTDLTSDQAATSLGQLMNVLGMSETDLVSFGNSLVNLGNNGASTEAQIVEMAARFGAAGKSAGLTNEEILALSSTVASMGIEVEAGGSSLSRLFNNIATNAGTGSKKAKTLAEALGFVFEDGSANLEAFKEAWAKDGLGTFQQLLEHLNELDQFEAAAFLKDIGVTNSRDVNALRLLGQGAEFLGDQLEYATDHQNAMTVESDKFFNTTQGQWKTLQNNVKDAAATIGAELLPVVNDLMKEFVDWLSLDTTQSDIKDFAKDIAENAKDFAGWLKDLDWDAIGNALSTAAGAAKALLDAFLSMPGWVQQILVGGFAVNKLTGGALGDLLGLGGKGLFKGLRGATPATPMFTKEVGLPGMGGGGGLGGVISGALKLALPFLAADIISRLLTGGEDGLITELDKKNFPGAKPMGGKGGADPSSFDTALTANFGGPLSKLATNEVIEALARTNEMGMEGIGTSFQVGLTNGLDPIGDVATRILARAEDPKAPAVMAEIQGHLSGLEEIQAQYLAQGDLALAAKVQQNIDTLHGLKGTTDETNAVLDYMRRDALSSDSAMLGTLHQIRDKNAKIAVTVNTSITVSAAAMNKQLTSYRESTGQGGFI